jgi:hypothetical protein
VASNYKAGEWIRVIGVPPNLPDEEPMKTRTLFSACVGKFFRIEEVEEAEGMVFIKLDVGHMRGHERYMESIWIEPEYVESTPKGSAEPGVE